MKTAPDIVDDDEIQKAALRLDDALCSFERATGVEHLLLLMPMEQTTAEGTHLSMSGKPIYDASAKKDFFEYNFPAMIKKIT